MAGFVEQATLKVNDQSSAQIAKINAELRKLAQTARSLKNIHVNIAVNERGVQQALRNLQQLRNAARSMGSTRINLNVNMAGINQAMNQMNRLRAQARQPITMGGAAGGRGGRIPPGVRQTGTAYQYGNLSIIRGALSTLIGGTMYAAAATMTKAATHAVVSSEDARMRLRQSGFDKGQKDVTPQTDFIMAMARKAQEEYDRIPAAAIADASVEQLNAIKAMGGVWDKDLGRYKNASELMQSAMMRVARNAQIMAITFKDPAKGAENARQLERLTQNLGQDVNEEAIKNIQEAAMRATIATGGEMKIEEMVRVTQQLGSAIAKSMTPQALLDIFMIREEGGKASTAEWRMAIQELSRGNINKKDRRAQIASGLRDAKGQSIPSVTRAATENLVQFTEDTIRPLLKKGGVDQATSMEIAAYLDEVVGFSQSSARGIADIITSLNNQDLQRQRAAATFADLDPHIGDKTFRGGSERLKASFDTALARNLDKMGPAFAEGIKPFSVAMDRAGKAAEKGRYSEATSEMLKGMSDMMGGTAGELITAVTAANAFKTLLDPTASTAEKGGAMLVTAASALMTAAGHISKWFGDVDPEKEVARLQQLKDDAPAELEALRQRRQEAIDKGQRDLIPAFNAKIAALEAQINTIEADITAARARSAAAKAKKAKEQAEDTEDFERLRREAGLDQYGPYAKPEELNKAKLLDKMKTDKRLAAGAKSVIDVMKAIDQPTSVKAREDFARQIGYTGKTGATKAIDKYILDTIRNMARGLKNQPLVPPLPPVPPPTEGQPIVLPNAKVDLQPGEWPTPPPPPPPPPMEGKPVPFLPEGQPIIIPGAKVTLQPGEWPTAPTPQPSPIPPSQMPPSMQPTGGVPFLTPMDTSTLQSTFSTIFGTAGNTAGSNAATTFGGQAGTIGSAIGTAVAGGINTGAIGSAIGSAAGAAFSASAHISVPAIGGGGGGGSPGPVTSSD